MMDFTWHLRSCQLDHMSMWISYTGPMAGGAFPPGDPAPRAVNEAFFKQVCPKERRTNITIEEVNQGLQGKPVIDVVDKYVQILKDLPDGCVELKGGMEHPFDWM